MKDELKDKLIEPDILTIQELFSDRFDVPVYQRPYSWQDSEIKTLLHDIQESYEKSVKSQENDKNTYLYVGNILLHNKKRGLYNIIDGQQRITTFALLLLAIYARLHELEVDVQDYQEIQQALWKDNRCVIELASVDKKIVDNLFKEGLNNPKQLKQFIERTYKPSTQFDENVKNNFLIA